MYVSSKTLQFKGSDFCIYKVLRYLHINISSLTFELSQNVVRIGGIGGMGPCLQCGSDLCTTTGVLS